MLVRRCVSLSFVLSSPRCGVRAESGGAAGYQVLIGDDASAVYASLVDLLRSLQVATALRQQPIALFAELSAPFV